jgi:NAD(P)-dependent dehydrogenase (short-subunit alcohol dehydrogenase family)
MDAFRLDGQVAVITGGSKGIGKAIGLAFAEAGADVVLAARSEEDLSKAAAEVEAASPGRRALTVPTDVGDPEQIQALVDRATAEFGSFDILVNNAGAAPFSATIDSMRPEGFEKYFRVNFVSAWYTTRAAAPVLLGKGSGCVLNVASVAAFIASPGISYYGSAKAALVSLTRTVAQEWAGSGVRVNAIAPGWVDTDLNAMLRASPDVERQILMQIPMGRWGRADEVAGAAVFLCSPGASFITGATLVVDGGQTVTSRFGA